MHSLEIRGLDTFSSVHILDDMDDDYTLGIELALRNATVVADFEIILGVCLLLLGRLGRKIENTNSICSGWLQKRCRWVNFPSIEYRFVALLD